MKKTRYTEEQIAFALKQAETGKLLRLPAYLYSVEAVRLAC
ncbi:hypothetical protein [Klebsiella michiganensis]|nr:hypothetical protein [Klebsiella michiganensis]